MIGEKEFFIRKAIGWGLRDMSKSDPDAVFDFLMKFKGKASGLTLREGSKRLPESKRKILLEKKSGCNLEFRAKLKSNLWDQLAEIFIRDEYANAEPVRLITPLLAKPRNRWVFSKNQSVNS